MHEIIRKLQNDLQATTEELEKYKRSQTKDKPPQPPQNHTKNITISFANNDAFNRKQIPYEETFGYESELTARNPIPSERALVDENIQRYKMEKAVAKPHQFINNFNINNFSSLNVSKSIKRAENSSPDISSLSFKYDESPDLSLSFSIQGDSNHQQVLFNSPL